MESLFRDQAPRLLATALRVTGNTQDAEDVLQTVFMRLVRRTGGSQLGQELTAYLHRAAVNAALDVLRSRSVQRTTSLDGAEARLPTPGSDDGESRVVRAELRSLVRQALAGLSPRAAEIFTLRYLEGFENHEIASMLGSSRSTVAVILHRARQHVREAIRPHVGGTGEKP
jgi:RNA polymerase sigma-70 factor (ECF subfamily)